MDWTAIRHMLRIGNLRVVVRHYGVDYYWRDRWLFVSAPAYIAWGQQPNRCLIDLRFGIKWRF